MSLKTTTKIGIALIIFVLMGSLAIAMPINIQPIITSEIDINISQTNKDSIIQDYNNSHWNETTPETVKEFLTLCPRCNWYKEGSRNMCSMTTRYLVIEGYQHGIDLNEVTLKYVTGVMGGHRMPTFEYEDKTYYIVNLCERDNRVVDNQGLHEIIRDLMEIDRFGFCNYKEFSNEWHLKYS